MTNEEKAKIIEEAFAEYARKIKELEEEYDAKIKQILREIDENKLKNIKGEIEKK